MILLPLAALLAIADPLPAASPATPPSEWVGIEASPGWITLSAEPNFGGPRPPPLTLGGALTVRVSRLQFAHFYWTPLQVGFGLAAKSGTNVLAHASTEVGGRAWSQSTSYLEIGVAAGAGALAVTYARGCDGACLVGGGPVVLAPVVRLGLDEGGRWPIGFFARLFLPSPDGEPFVTHNNGYALALLFGVDIGVARF